MKQKQSNSKQLWIIVGTLVVVAVGATTYALTSNNDKKVNDSDQTAEEMGMTDEEHVNMDKAGESEVATGGTVIVFTDDGFSPESYTSKVGDIVIVRNDSSMNVEFSSDDHPTHRDNPDLNMDILEPGKTGQFTPPGKGTYGFHDHINDQFTGTLTVE